jgi:spore maturation protein CgeB
MKLLKLTSFYTTYIRDFYARNLGMESQTYAQQKAALDYDAFGWGDFWSHALKPMDYEVMEVTANIEPLQMAWAREHGVAWRQATWVLDMAWEQVIRFQPTILFVDDYSTFSYQWLTEIRQTCPSIGVILGWCGAPPHDAGVFKAYDAVLSCIPELVDYFRNHGHRSFHLNHAFEPRLLGRLAEVEQDIDFSFVGSINRGKDGHGERERLLVNLASQVPMQIFIPNLDLTWTEELKTLAKGILYGVMQASKRIGIPPGTLIKLPRIGPAALWSFRPMAAVHPRLKKFVRPAVFGLEMYQTLRRSKVTFNHHIDISAQSASNMRLFEATGVGACIITDWKNNLKELFVPEQEIVTYKSAGECAEKVRWLLSHPRERQMIAQAGQARTLRDYTFTQRAVQLDKIIKNLLKVKIP